MLTPHGAHFPPRHPVLLQDLGCEGLADAKAVAAELGGAVQIHLLVVDPGSGSGPTRPGHQTWKTIGKWWFDGCDFMG